ncbi:MAG: hypothetical protein ACRDJV_13170 [Actinomycetota bacterium]
MGTSAFVLELNDEIVQGLAVAKMAFETGEQDHGLKAVTETLRRAQKRSSPGS